MKAPRVDTLHEEIDRLAAEVAEVRAAQKRLVLATDADRSRIERELHEGIQQRLVALAVSVQLAGASREGEPGSGTSAEELEREVQEALDESARLAQRIYPALLEAGGLAAALRSAAVQTGTPSSVTVAAGLDFAPHIARTIYWCWLELIEQVEPGGRATITVGLAHDAVTFDIIGRAGAGAWEGLRERVGALGGELSVDADVGGETRLHGRLPVDR